MTDSLSRRRFLIDLAYIGGGLALAAGLGAISTPPPPAPAPAATPLADPHHPQYTSVQDICVGRP